MSVVLLPRVGVLTRPARSSRSRSASTERISTVVRKAVRCLGYTGARVQLRSWLEEGVSPIVVSGPEGSGTTTLTRAVLTEWVEARLRVRAPARRIWAAELGGLDQEDVAWAELSALVGEPVYDGDALVRAFEGERETLALVLDGAEGVPGVVQSIADALARRAGTARLFAGRQLLVTSRVPIALGRDGESRAIALTAFVESEREAARELVQRTFEERAGRALDASEQAFVDTVVSETDGRPRSLVLAGARAIAIGPGELSKRLRKARTRSKGLDRDVWALVEELSPDARAVLAPAASFTRVARLPVLRAIALALAPEADVDRGVVELVRRGWLEERETGRVELVPPFREHVASRLVDDAVRDAHAAAHARIAAELVRSLGGARHREALTALRHDRRELVRALAHVEGDAKLGGELVRALVALDGLVGAAHVHGEAVAACVRKGATRDPRRPLFLATQLVLAGGVGIGDEAERRTAVAKLERSLGRGEGDVAAEVFTSLVRAAVVVGDARDALLARAVELARADASSPGSSRLAEVLVAVADVHAERLETAAACASRGEALALAQAGGVALESCAPWLLQHGLHRLELGELGAADTLARAVDAARTETSLVIALEASSALARAQAIATRFDAARGTLDAARKLAGRLGAAGLGATRVDARLELDDALVALAGGRATDAESGSSESGELASRFRAVAERFVVTGRPVLAELARRVAMAIDAGLASEGVLDRARRADAVLQGFEPGAVDARLVRAVFRAAGRAMPEFEVRADRSAFRARGESEWVDLTRRPVARLLLVALLEARERQAGLTLWDVRHALWPGERMLESAARERVHAIVKILRDLGMRPALTWNGTTYQLEGVIVVLD